MTPSRREIRPYRAQSLPKPVPAPDSSASTLVAALQSAAAGVEDSRARLEETVCAYVAHLKADGMFAEQALIRVKKAIEQAGLRRDGSNVDLIIDRVITLCIEEFYKTP